MPEVHTHCNGCGKEIFENDEKIVTVTKGKAALLDNEMTLASFEDTVWFGHENCHFKPFQSAQAFLHSVVFRELRKALHGNYNRVALRNLFQKHGWPMEGE